MSAKSYVIDASAALRLGPPLPSREKDKVVLRVPADLTLQVLRDCPIGKKLMRQENWYDRYPWSRTAPPAGDYCLRLPVPRSQNKTFANQQALLPPEEQVAPVVVVAIALLCINRRRGADPLNSGWSRCIELADGGHSAVGWVSGQLYITSVVDDFNDDSVMMASLRTS